jgi:hypothetical protein
MEFKEKLKNGVTITVKTHRGFTELEKLECTKPSLGQYFGRHQFIYLKDDDEISLVEMTGINDIWFWEIYCLKGELFEDTERFKSKQEAENKILRYLDLVNCI